MKLEELLGKLNFKWNEEKRMLVREVSINDIKEILEFFGIANDSEHDVYIHGFNNWNSRNNIIDDGLLFLGSHSLQSTMLLLANTEHFAIPYNEMLAKYTQLRNGNAIIGVIPESVDNIYLGKSDRKLNSDEVTRSVIYDCKSVPMIYSTVGNENTQYCPYDQMLCKNSSLIPELIFGAMTALRKNDPEEEVDFDKFNRNEKLFKLEINPKFVLIEDYIQKNGMTNLESLKNRIVEEVKEKACLDYFYLDRELSINLVEVIKLCYNPNYVVYRDEYVAKKKESNLNF